MNSLKAKPAVIVEVRPMTKKEIKAAGIDETELTPCAMVLDNGTILCAVFEYGDCKRAAGRLVLMNLAEETENIL